MGEHWDAARTAIGKARWHCETRDISPEIAEMRRELALAGKTLEDIGTSEAEISALLSTKRGNRNPAKSAKTYAKSVARLLKKGNLRSARTALTMLDRNLADAGLDLATVGVTQARYDAWYAKLRPPKKQKTTKTKS
jgi:cob(I)alamin adenosyltransferase